MANKVGHQQCPDCMDSGKDNLILFDDNSQHCFACGKDVQPWDLTITETVADKATTVPCLGGICKAIPSRALSLATVQKYEIESLEYTGHIGGTYVYMEPCLIFNWRDAGRLSKHKLRKLSDRSVCAQSGDTKYKGLFGQHLFQPSKSVPVIIAEAELDAASAFQVLGWPAVSIGGTGNASSLIKANIEWLSGFKHVILAFDSDDAGRVAAAKVIDEFEVGTVRVASFPLKDINEMLVAGREEELKKCLWNAAISRPSTVVTIDDILESGIEQPRVGRPYFSKALTDITYGMMDGTLTVIAAGTATGKTNLLNEITFGLVEQGEKVGLFGLEQTPKEAILRLVSNKLNRRLYLPGCEGWDQQLVEEESRKMAESVFLYSNKGIPTLASLLLTIRFMTSYYGCKTVIIDNLTSLLAKPMVEGKRVGDIDYIGVVASECVNIANELGISVILVSHLTMDRIQQSVKINVDTSSDALFDVDEVVGKDGLTWDTGRLPDVDHCWGSKVLTKLAHNVLGLGRNRLSTNPTIKSNLKIKQLKSRLNSELDGKIVDLYYSYDTGRLTENRGN